MAVSKRLRYEILRRDNHTCRYCGRAAPDVALTVDHVIPVALGGTDEPDNLVAACVDCNAGKTSIAPDSPLVEQVTADTVRWAKAMRRAADNRRADFASDDGCIEDFRAAWIRWTTDDGATTPLPPGWQTSLFNLLDAGLEMEDLLHFIPVAMDSLAAHENKFRYWAGCCWHEVRRRTDDARRIVDRWEKRHGA